MTDTDLLASIQAELAWDPAVEDRGIVVSVKDGVVALAGQVSTYPARWAAEKAVKRVAGVRGIANDVEVKPSTQRTDKEIATAAVNALKANISDARWLEIETRAKLNDVDLGTVEIDPYAIGLSIGRKF